MTGPPAARADLHVAILFHESTILGAGVSILRGVEYLRPHGWTGSGWFPGPGSLVTQSATVLDRWGYAVKPIAFSVRSWRRDPGIVQRLRQTPAYLSAFRKWMKETAPDVVHVNSLLMLPEATIARRLGLPIVVQVHEVPPRGRKRDITLRWAAGVADVLIGVSRPVSEMLGNHAGRTPVITVHNGVPRVEARPPPEGEFIVGTVGHVSRTKGTEIFLEAAALALERRPTLRFEHIGPARPWGDDEYENDVEATARSPQLRGRVHMLGHRQVRGALARWSLFVLSSRQEGFPLGTLEAMAVGLPVIATEVGGVPEQIVHLESGVLVPAEDASALANWIVRLHDDDALRRRLGIMGRRRVRVRFPLEAQARALDEAYLVALERRRRL